MKFSKKFKSSKNPRKQRAYVRLSPLHLRQKMLASHLSAELIKKYGMRAISIRKNDKVLIMRGDFKGIKGTVERTSLREMKVYVDNAKTTKKDGTRISVPLNASNLMIIELNLDDKKRLKESVKK